MANTPVYSRKAVKSYEQDRVLQQNGKLSGAERAYRKAIKVNPDFVEAPRSRKRSSR